MRAWRLPFTLLAWLAGTTALAQDLPASHIWLAGIEEGVPQAPQQISAGDRYNNQPRFSPDGQFVYYTAEQADGQTDIARHEIAMGRTTRLVPTPESEYSPTPIPGTEAVSVVRVEKDGRQRLWRLEPESGVFSLWRLEPESGVFSLLLPDVEPVGYHAWVAEDLLALFVLGEPHSLQVAVPGNGLATRVFDNIGRTLRRHPLTNEILFVDKGVEPWRIASLDPADGSVTGVIGLFPEHEDFEVDPGGRYWMGSGSRLYRSNAGNERWELTADLREYGIDDITRLGISPDGKRLAIVGSP